MAGIDFSVGYEREEFLGFLQREFLPNDFKVTIAHVDLTAFNTRYISALTVLGECESLDLVVFEIEHNSQKDARISLAKETYKILKNSFSLRALVIYHAKDSENYRFSFLEYTSDDNNRRETLPPKRYSYLLGKGIATHTPDKYLLDKGRVISAEDLKNRFSVEVLTKEFYNELFLWYQWTLSGEVNVFFPENASNEERLDTKIIRLITRIIFVWFIKQKDLVPDKLFDTDYLTSVLKDFNPQDTEQGNFYNAILQNLFFATLNRAIVDEKGNKRCFAKAKNQTDLKTLYRYADLFKISQEEVVEMFGSVPFLNGGLFECLDKVKRLDGVEKAYYYDGFSRNDNKRANLPNILFFHEERGLISIFKRYNFTVEENAPNDVVVSLDPELLGKVFENLLGVYNPETSQTARNATGSFYTPREIVGYMVDECLKQYLGRTPEVEALFEEDFQKQEGSEEEYLLIAEKLQKVKILDPACGSGAFPMGLLNRMADLLEKILIDKTPYELKLAIIEHCIYGVDIQNIAVQISKLRFFISLICDCEKDETKPNFNIPTLPNLETKFVAANTLIGKKIKASDELSFDPPEIETCKMNLAKIRHEHFSAKTSYQKEKLRKEDESVREKLVELLEKYGKCSLEDAEQLAKWSPYDQNDVADFFDAEWMFGVKDGFNIIIGNPPYVQVRKGIVSKEQYPYSEGKDKGKQNLYKLFVEASYNFLKLNGISCLIVQSSLMCDLSSSFTRELLLTKTSLISVIEFPKTATNTDNQVFKSVLQGTCIVVFKKRQPSKDSVFGISINNDASTIKSLVFENVVQSSIKESFPSRFEIPLIEKGEMSIISKIKVLPRLESKISDSLQGNINTIHLSEIRSEKPTDIFIVKGANVHKYCIDSECFFGKNNEQVNTLVNENHTAGAVIATQNITGTTDKHRIHAAYAECKNC